MSAADRLRYLEARGYAEQGRTGGWWRTDPSRTRRPCWVCRTPTRLRGQLLEATMPCCGACAEELVWRWPAGPVAEG